MYNFGKQIPVNSYSTQVVDTSKLHDVTYSGVYRLLINSSLWRRNTHHNGGTWDSVKLICVAYSLKGTVIGKLTVDLSLSSNKAHQLAYFLSFINQDGEFYLPEPTHHEGVSKTGKEYCFDAIDELHRKSVHALIKYKGMNDQGYHQYECIGFCDHRGFSAADLSNHASHRCAEYQQFIDSLQQVKQQPAQSYSYVQQANAGYYQQATQPQQKKATDDVLPF